MKNLSWSKISLICLIAFTGYITYFLFNTKFAEITIHYLAFLAGIFLIAEGLYKITTSKAPLFPDQFLRGFRVITGIWIVVIHLYQFIEARILPAQAVEITIDYRDYFPFFAGIFLVVEGFYRISGSKTPFLPDQFLRILRIVIGVSLVTIHLLQFIHISTTYITLPHP